MASSSYLIVITGRKQIAQVWGRPIYVITRVSLIPLSSLSEAKFAIEKTRKALESGEGVHAGAAADSDTTDDEAEHDHVQAATGDGADDPKTPRKEKRAIFPSGDDQSVAQDVFNRRGAYGRFAERWFSKKGWSVERRKSQGLSADAPEIRKAQTVEGDAQSPSNSGATEQKPPTLNLPESPAKESSNIVAALTPKLLRTTQLLLNSQSFYFSYDHDITHRIGSNSGKNVEIPLHRRADPMVSLTRGRFQSCLMPVSSSGIVTLSRNSPKQAMMSLCYPYYKASSASARLKSILRNVQ